jgi:four helix bundle protein
MSFERVEDIRAWRQAYSFKLAIYGLIRTEPLAADFTLCDQLRDAAASTVSQIEEGFARFYPKDFGRMVVGAKASMQECRGHLRDAVDRGHITDAKRAELDSAADGAMKEMAGLIDYLQSPEAEENARRIRARSGERRAARLRRREQNKPVANSEAGTEPRTESS